MTDALDRFFAKVEEDPETECWNWTACVSPEGYGKFHFEGKVVYAHRFAYMELIREIPDELVLNKVCKSRVCVNPDHLDPVTRKVNVNRGDLHLVNGSKTHCKFGHPFDKKNTYRIVDKDGFKHRQCRECKRRY